MPNRVISKERVNAAEYHTDKPSCLEDFSLYCRIQVPSEVANGIKRVSLRCTLEWRSRFKWHTEDCDEQEKCGTLYADVHSEFRGISDTELVAKLKARDRIVNV
jgi:hypothetical protein